MGRGDSPDIETLLGHAAWLRGLASRLVPAGIHVDDVVQETWLAALRRPPRTGRNLRGWLAAVARNAGRQMRRSETRRTARESRARPGAEPADPAVIAARAEIQREIADAVLALEEPYRALIVLRFYEGRDPADIARILDIAPATVRSRQRRAIERLRETLDAGRDGDRRAWCLPLVALGLARRNDDPPAPAPTTPWAIVAAGIAAVAILTSIPPDR